MERGLLCDEQIPPEPIDDQRETQCGGEQRQAYRSHHRAPRPATGGRGGGQRVWVGWRLTDGGGEEEEAGEVDGGRGEQEGEGEPRCAARLLDAGGHSDGGVLAELDRHRGSEYGRAYGQAAAHLEEARGGSGRGGSLAIERVGDAIVRRTPVSHRREQVNGGMAQRKPEQHRGEHLASHAEGGAEGASP